MRIFLDTNVIMDYLTSRGDVEIIGRIFRSIDSGEHIAFISIGSYYTIVYLTERFLKAQGLKNPQRLIRMREILTTLLESIEVAGHTREELMTGTNDVQFKDLEDYLHRHPEMDERLTCGGTCQYLTTESATKFRESASLFLQEEVNVQRITLN